MDESKRIYVGKEGELLRGSEVTGAERVAEVTGDTFYVNPGSVSQAKKSAGEERNNPHSLDLDAIAEAVRKAQELLKKTPTWPAEGGDTCPPDPWRSTTSQSDETSTDMYVGKEGELRSANGELLLDHETTWGERVAEVTDDTFYATRLAEEAEFVRTHMPANTRRTSDGTFVGWYFAITNEFGDTYKLFLYYHKGMGVYRVVLVDPRLEGKADVHIEDRKSVV